MLLGAAGIVDGVGWRTLSLAQQALLLALLVLTARAQASALILLPGLLLGYLMIHWEVLAGLGSLAVRIEIVIMPWRLAALGLGTVIVARAGACLQQRKPGLLSGPFAQPFLAAPSWAWIFLPGVILSGLAALYHTAVSELRQSAIQLWAPYLGALAFGMVGWSWQRVRFFVGAGLLLVLGNIHLVRVFGGEFLLGHGLSELHAICLGLGLSLLQASIVRRIRYAAQLIPGINLASLALAGLILALLSVNYFTAPNLAAITPTRLLVSGTLAWLAGWYFRRAARHPGPGEKRHIELCEALYHFGLVLAIWCAALLVPWFRQPLFTPAALCLPTAYFYVRAEFGVRAGRPEGRGYCTSAAVLGFVVLALYGFKSIFHLVLFPGTPIGTEYYHHNAPLILLLGVVLLRLHGLGGTQWLAFYGGLALMVSS